MTTSASAPPGGASSLLPLLILDPCSPARLIDARHRRDDRAVPARPNNPFSRRRASQRFGSHGGTRERLGQLERDHGATAVVVRTVGDRIEMRGVGTMHAVERGTTRARCSALRFGGGSSAPRGRAMAFVTRTESWSSAAPMPTGRCASRSRRTRAGATGSLPGRMATTFCAAPRGTVDEAGLSTLSDLPIAPTVSELSDPSEAESPSARVPSSTVSASDGLVRSSYASRARRKNPGTPASMPRRRAPPPRRVNEEIVAPPTLMGLRVVAERRDEDDDATARFRRERRLTRRRRTPNRRALEQPPYSCPPTNDGHAAPNRGTGAAHRAHRRSAVWRPCPARGRRGDRLEEGAAVARWCVRPSQRTSRTR